MESQLVRYSRAGDAFHYRWAARRCLRLVELNSPLRCITIEGSKESEQAGEYAIDLAEYSEPDANSETIAYYQLKHSTVRTSRAFFFSELEPTLEQFGKRYTASVVNRRKAGKARSVRFSFITNRSIPDKIKKAVAAISGGHNTPIRGKFEQATGLKGSDLRNFCAALSLVDREGDYQVQKHELHGEMADYLTGAVERNEVDGLIALIIDRALPKSEDNRPNGEIYREDVLQRLGVTSMGQLFPAPHELENLSNPIKRDQHESLLAHVLASPQPTIIHSAGGVGKSVVARQLLESLTAGSWGLIYDCFGAGNYRNPSQSRHQARIALTQMANEMAVAGLCRPLVPRVNQSSEDLFRGFVDRVKQAITALRTARADAALLILIDAADNAEMAAVDFGDNCFARALLREPLPEGCRLVELCRTERVPLLRPRSTVQQYELLPFSPAETAAYLRTFFPSASPADASEFHRLTSGNPRVQANALSARHGSVTEALNSLGPAGTTVEDQIEAQLDTAISGLKDKHPETASRQVDAICLGLANLPPFIPLDILASAAGVDVPTIKSFVSDLGRPLWLSDDAVQFRDEPTETWFYKKFAAEKNQVRNYIAALEPFAAKATYAAKALPQLLHRAEEHHRLVELALSDEFLPEDNPIDARNIRVYRLQFAFKAALKLKRFSDACRLAFRAGEEVAGDRRQMELLEKNVDLIPRLQAVHRVQELAYRGMLRSAWDGSENAYSAALLSSVEAFKGEARGYLRGAEKWMQMYFQERTKQTEDHFHEDRLRDQDVVELAWAHFNLGGAAGAVTFLRRWRPPHFIFRISGLLIRRLVDASLFEQIDEISLLAAKNIYIMLAVSDELIAVGRFPPKESLRHTLDFLAKKSGTIEKGGRYSYEDYTITAVLSFCEAAAARGLARSKIKAVLKKFAAAFADRSVADDHFDEPRRRFLRGASLRAALDGGDEPDAATFIYKKDDKQERGYDQQDEDKQLKEVIGALFPWYFLRARILARDSKADSVDLEATRSRSKAALHGRYRTYDRIPFEVSVVRFEVLMLKFAATTQDLENFATNVIARADEKLFLRDRLPAARAAFRLPHLASLRERLEQSCRRTIEGIWDQGPEERADAYINLARAVFPSSQADAAAYFTSAVEAVSKFGDEMVDRWNAVVAVAKRAANAKKANAHLTYRFVRSGEIVGKTVAREKYWDRDEVFKVAVNLHAPSGLAALSRWRDRTVGWFKLQLPALATESVTQNVISPSCGWGLTGFGGCNGSANYASCCISREPEKEKREIMLRATLRDIQLADKPPRDLQVLSETASEFPAEETLLARIIANAVVVDATKPPLAFATISEETQRAPRIDALLKDVDLLNANALQRAVEAMRTMESPREFDSFWDEVVGRVPPGQEATFLNTFLALENTSYFEASHVIAKMRKSWLQKAAVRRGWPSFLIGVGKRFAIDLTNAYRLSYWCEQGDFPEEDLAAVRNGVIDGLSESLELVEATTFFGFVTNAVNLVTPDESLGLLDYALSRIENHIPPDFGDGEWSDWLQPPDAISDCVAGLIWSALGSPYSSTRWEAAHCVRRFADLGRAEELAALVRWMDSKTVGSFGSQRYPFYHLHSRLYLLIAFARVAIDHPHLLHPHSKLFATIALEGLPHVLIQKKAADIALRIEQAMPGTYNNESLDKLRQVGVSLLPGRTVTGYSNPPVDTPWHVKGEVDDTIKLPFDVEFDRYWFNQLGSIFGVPNNQIEDLAREIAVRQLGIPVGNDDYSYEPDPRLHQWNSGNYYERGTSHDHGSYPRTDTHSFYYSYHSFLCVAAKLLQYVPVVIQTESWEQGDKWAEWLTRHSITRHDGRWLADRRDPAPVKRRRWVHANENENWRWHIQGDDFIDVLVNQSSSAGFLCVSGYWEDCVGDRIEQIRVQSALVNKKGARSLASSLREARSDDFSLPSYGSEDREFLTPPFELVGWIKRRDGGDGRLDRFDPHAKEIYYPPEEVGETYASLLELSADYEKRKWSQPVSPPSVITEIWSNKDIGRRQDEPSRSGDRMSVSLDVLKQLCDKSGKDLILGVEINRRLHRDYRYRGSGDDDVYTIASHKIFLLSSDGLLRDARETHQLG